jgi:hypothetical protein
MFGKSYIYKRLNVSTGEITEHTFHTHDLLGAFKQLNEWNKMAPKRWNFWIEKEEEDRLNAK